MKKKGHCELPVELHECSVTTLHGGIETHSKVTQTRQFVLKEDG